MNAREYLERQARLTYQFLYRQHQPEINQEIELALVQYGHPTDLKGIRRAQLSLRNALYAYCRQLGIRRTATTGFRRSFVELRISPNGVVISPLARQFKENL